MRNLATLLCVTLVSAAVSAAEPSEEQWFEVNAVGFHHHGNPDVVALNQEDIAKYFVAQRPFLSESFRKERLSELLEKNKDQEFKPERSVPMRDPRCFAEVSRINTNEVIIKILKPLGAWRWHHHFQCLAIYKTQRNKTVDNIFALDKLYAKLSFTFQGIGHGMAGPDFRAKDNAIIKAFGEPDYEYPGQSPSLGQFYYEKHDLHIVTHEFVVYYVEHGKPDWVGDMTNQRLAGEWVGTLDSDNRILVTFTPQGTFELVNVDPETPLQIRSRATGSFKTDFSVSPHHLDLDANITKPNHDEPVKHTFELIVKLESKDSFRMSHLESDARPKEFGKKSVVMRRATPTVEQN